MGASEAFTVSAMTLGLASWTRSELMLSPWSIRSDESKTVAPPTYKHINLCCNNVDINQNKHRLLPLKLKYKWPSRMFVCHALHYYSNNVYLKTSGCVVFSEVSATIQTAYCNCSVCKCERNNYETDKWILTFFITVLTKICQQALSLVTTKQ